MLRAALTAALALALAAPTPAADACAPPPQTREIPVTADGATIPSNGGVIVEERQVDDRPPRPRRAAAGATADAGADAPAAPAAPDSPTPPAPTGDPVDLVRVDLGRGLAVLRPPPRAKGSGPRALRLSDGRGGETHLYGDGPAGPKLAAPRLRRAGSDASRAEASRGDRYGSPSATVTFELRDAPPPDAYALLVYDPRWDQGQAVIWIEVSPGAPLRYAFNTGGKGCNGAPATLYRGARLTFAWLSHDGRVSPRSAAVQLGAPAPEAP